MSALFGYSFFCWLIACFFIFIPGPSVNGELFTAMVDLEKLLDTERLLVSSLDAYLVGEERRLKQLRDIKQKLSHIESIASQDVHSYLANPVNAFLLVKALTSDWKNAEALMISGSSEIGQQIVNRLLNNTNHETFPSIEDLNGAADALLRLQDTYKLETSSLARGEIKIQNPTSNLQPSQLSSLDTKRLELSAGDCFELGRYSYVNGDHYHTILWMQEALDRYEEEDFKTADKADILEYLAFSTYRQGNIRHALKLTTELININPNHPRAPANKLYYEQALGKTSKSRLRGDNGEDVPVDDFISTSQDEKETNGESESQIYESLCRGEVRISPRTASQLVCHYLDTRNKPYLRYSRIKVEEAYKKPLIQIFHDIMSDREIEIIKELASPRLKRATVQNYKTGELEVAHYRISKSGWLKNSDHEVVDRVNKRIEAITGLTTATAEELQVVNYGLGGHYEPHYDFARREEKDAFKSLGTGNRIATWLNYMSNVEAGGATVFPILGISLWPKQGTAAFWYNLYRSGEGDLLTRHAACPVLVGSKWVSNKWFHERGQEFLRPCGLRINE